MAQFKMSLYEQKIILLCISKIKNTYRKSKDGKTTCLKFVFGAKEIKDFLKVHSRGLYTELKPIADKLTSHKIYISHGEDFSFIVPIPFCEYKKGIFTIRFDQSMEEYLLELKDKFTMYDINNIRDLQSNYSIRIYEVLKSYEWLNEAVFDIDEIKKVIGVKSFDEETNDWIDLYPRYPNFKQRVLLVAQKELEEKTDIQFNFIELKMGRKVTQIKFIILGNSENLEQLEQFQIEELSEPLSLKEVPESKIIPNMEEIAAEIVPVEIDIDDLIDELREFIKEPLKTKDLKTILTAADNNISLIKAKYELAKKQKKISNLAAWLISALKDDYSNPVEVEQCTGQVQIPYMNSQTNRFVNYEQDKWDFDELEKKERELIRQKLEI